MSAPEAVVTALASARKAVQLYPPSHPAHGEALDSLVSSVAAATTSGQLVLNWYQGRLYCESIVLPADVHGASSIAEAFESRSIESLTFSPGFSATDALGLTEVLSLRPSPSLDVEAELAARSVTAVRVAMLEDEEDEEREERDRQRQADRAMYTRVIGALRRVREQLQGGGADLGETVNLVAGVMERLMTDSAAVLGLATMRGGGDRELFHSLNVMIYTLALGERLGLPEEGLSSLGLSALMHDVGKAAFDADDPAQAEPARLMHPQVGAEIIQRLGLEDPAPFLVAFEHHMHTDGTGWPERAADYIAHPYSRMVAIADRYENLVNGGEDSLTPDKAVVQVLREAGKSLDPFFARLFGNAMGVFPIGCLVRLSDHSVGVVVRHGEDPLAPVIRLAYTERGAEIDDPTEIDLSRGDVRLVEVISPESLAIEVSDKL